MGGMVIKKIGRTRIRPIRPIGEANPEHPGVAVHLPLADLLMILAPLLGLAGDELVAQAPTKNLGGEGLDRLVQGAREHELDVGLGEAGFRDKLGRSRSGVARDQATAGPGGSTHLPCSLMSATRRSSASIWGMLYCTHCLPT